jgi:hypothetical protein
MVEYRPNQTNIKLNRHLLVYSSTTKFHPHLFCNFIYAIVDSQAQVFYSVSAVLIFPKALSGCEFWCDREIKTHIHTIQPGNQFPYTDQNWITTHIQWYTILLNPHAAGT